MDIMQPVMGIFMGDIKSSQFRLDICVEPDGAEFPVEDRFAAIKQRVTRVYRLGPDTSDVRSCFQ